MTLFLHWSTLLVVLYINTLFFQKILQNLEKITKILDDNLPSLKNSYSQIIEGPVVIGVVSMQNGVIKLRVSAKTEPEEHYSVKRALLKSIKQILDSNNIEMYTANKKEAENDK